MQHYELMFIADPAAEEGLDEVKQKIEGLITGREGSVVSYDKLGKKRLAYTVAKRQYGVYFLVNFKGNGKIVQALDYFLRLNPVVIRHIIIAFSEKQLALRQRTETVLAEEAERMRLGGRPVALKIDEGEVIAAEGNLTAVEEITVTLEEGEEFVQFPIEAAEFAVAPVESELQTEAAPESAPQEEAADMPKPQPELSGELTDDIKATITE